ncbi:MAG TPA: dihydroorotase [Flavobacteriales bacterium]|jgi:dihydroorotase|nr:dihydroorotase [Flavobacteriales bacterium]
MTELLLKQVKVMDPGGPHHDAILDIRVRDGVVTELGERLMKGAAREVSREGLHLSPGWVDLRAHFREPGEEWKQGILNGLDAAARGGFTAVAVLPSTTPTIDGRAGIDHLLHRSFGHAVKLLPLGGLTKGLKGEQLAELHDQRLAGAVGFTDDLHAIRNTRLMLLALQYSQGLPGEAPPIMVQPSDPYLTAGSQMHEGAMSTRLGLKGAPALAEQVLLQRDIALLAYAGGHLHVVTVSTAEGVALVRDAKARGLKVTASVAAHHLLLDDGCLRGFETCYKVWPPLRDPGHIEALREGVKDGTIDAIVSDHRPEDREHKVLEYGQAAFGIIGLETSFAVANTALKGRMSLRRTIERYAHGPRQVLGLPKVHVTEGMSADLSLFDPEENWTCEATDLVSRSHNTPFLGQRFTGRALGIVARGQVVLHPVLSR